MNDVRLLQWDTRFFGMRIARFRPSRLHEKTARAAFDYCRRNRVRCLYYLADLGDSRSMAVAQTSGFRLADVRMTLTLRLTDESRWSSLNATSRAPVRDFKETDRRPLQQIARKSFRHSRFYYDKNFPRKKSQELYAEWIGKACRGFADKVFVASAGGRPVGFIACDLERSLKKGRFPLIGVDRRFAGRGIGKSLVRSALLWFRSKKVEKVEVVTQARNYQAHGLYERCGFTLSHASVWYHKWFSET